MFKQDQHYSHDDDGGGGDDDDSWRWSFCFEIGSLSACLSQ